MHDSPRSRSSGLVPGLILICAAAWIGAAPLDARQDGQTQQDDGELERLLTLERDEAQAALQKGDVRAGLRLVDEHLELDPTDAASRRLRALLRRRATDWPGALEDAQRALEDAKDGDPRLRAAC